LDTALPTYAAFALVLNLCGLSARILPPLVLVVLVVQKSWRGGITPPPQGWNKVWARFPVKAAPAFFSTLG